MLSAAVFFALMGAIIRLLREQAPHISPFMIGTVRFAVGNLFVFAAFATGRSKARWVNWRWILVRGVMGGIGTISYFWAIGEFGLARGTLFAATSTIFAALFAIPILGERLSAGHWIAIAVAVAGMGMMCEVRGFTFTAKELLGFSVGLTWGIAVVSVTKCRETDTSMNVFWSQCIFGLAFAVGPTVYERVLPSGYEWFLLLLIALLAIAGQLCMTSAYKYTGATYGSLVSLLNPVLATTIAIVIFAERPSWRFWVGAAMILLPCVYLSLYPVRRRPGAVPAEVGLTGKGGGNG